jgi:hypothetical protein
MISCVKISKSKSFQSPIDFFDKGGVVGSNLQIRRRRIGGEHCFWIDVSHSRCADPTVGSADEYPGRGIWA